MYYEINVAKNGRHYFATAERSLTDEQTAHKVFEEFEKKFPETEGYSLRMTYYQNVGKVLIEGN